MVKKESKTLTTKVHDAILEMIINAGSESENMLLTEREIVERFGVSKAPVREALLRLCSEEVLTSIPRCGYVVVRVGEKSGRDNLMVRQMLELSSLDRFFSLFTPERIDAIDRNLQVAAEECQQDNSVWTIWRCNLQFHSDLVAVSDNPYLLKHLTSCIDVERRFFAQNEYLSSKKFQTEFNPTPHQKILEAIRAGDKPLALERLSNDISNRF